MSASSGTLSLRTRVFFHVVFVLWIVALVWACRPVHAVTVLNDVLLPSIVLSIPFLFGISAWLIGRHGWIFAVAYAVIAFIWINVGFAVWALHLWGVTAFKRLLAAQGHWSSILFDVLYVSVGLLTYWFGRRRAQRSAETPSQPAA